MQVLDLVPPTREELVQYVQAQQQNEAFQSAVKNELGDSFYDLLGFYGGLTKEAKTQFREQNSALYSTIQNYYTFREQYATDHPDWGMYYGPDATPSATPVKTTEAHYTPTSFVKPSIVRHEPAPRSSIPLPRTPGTGYGYQNNKYNPKPYFGITSRAGMMDFSSLSPAFLKAAGSSLTWEIAQAFQNNRPVSNAGRSYLENLRSRHPEWNSQIDSILNH
jgi:hypothetical protein